MHALHHMITIQQCCVNLYKIVCMSTITLEVLVNFEIRVGLCSIQNFGKFNPSLNGRSIEMKVQRKVSHGISENVTRIAAAKSTFFMRCLGKNQ